MNGIKKWHPLGDETGRDGTGGGGGGHAGTHAYESIPEHTLAYVTCARVM